MSHHTGLLHPKPSVVWQIKDGDCPPHIGETGGGFAGLRLAVIHREAIEYSSLLIARIESETTAARSMRKEIVTNGLDAAQ